MKVVSKLNKSYSVKYALTIIGLIFFIIVFFSISILFFAGIMAVVILFIEIYKFFKGYKQFTVSDYGIEIKDLFTEKKRLIKYEQIERLTTKRNKQKEPETKVRISIYRTSEIKLTNGETIYIHENDYENYTEIIDQIKVYLNN